MPLEYARTQFRMLSIFKLPQTWRLFFFFSHILSVSVIALYKKVGKNQDPKGKRWLLLKPSVVSSVASYCSRRLEFYSVLQFGAIFASHKSLS